MSVRISEDSSAIALNLFECWGAKLRHSGTIEPIVVVAVLHLPLTAFNDNFCGTQTFPFLLFKI
jgi:hypothetical protein